LAQILIALYKQKPEIEDKVGYQEPYTEEEFQQIQNEKKIIF